MRLASEVRSRVLRFVVAASLGVVVWVPAAARAEGFVDPSYGRVNGDLAIAVGVGGTVASSGPRPDAELRVRYLESAGIYGTYEDGATVGISQDPSRVIMGGFE